MAGTAARAAPRSGVAALARWFRHCPLGSVGFPSGALPSHSYVLCPVEGSDGRCQRQRQGHGSAAPAAARAAGGTGRRGGGRGEAILYLAPIRGRGAAAPSQRHRRRPIVFKAFKRRSNDVQTALKRSNGYFPNDRPAVYAVQTSSKRPKQTFDPT